MGAPAAAVPVGDRYPRTGAAATRLRDEVGEPTGLLLRWGSTLARSIGHSDASAAAGEDSAAAAAWGDLKSMAFVGEGEASGDDPRVRGFSCASPFRCG